MAVEESERAPPRILAHMAFGVFSQVLAKLQTELLQPKALASITKSVEKAIQNDLRAPKYAGASWSRNARSSRISSQPSRVALVPRHHC